MPSRNPFESEPAFGDWLLAAVLGGAAIAALLWGLSHAGAHGDLRTVFEPAKSAQSASASPGEASEPGQQGTAESLPPTTIAPLPARGTVVNVCTVNGKRVYSDQPCGPDAKVKEIDTAGMNTYAPPAIDTRPVVVTPSVVASPPVVVPIERPGETTPNAGLCDAIQREIDALDARMRNGYRSQEGEYLRGRRQDAKERFHLAGCTWHEVQ